MNLLQPFELLKPVHVERLIKLEKYFLVSQSYDRLPSIPGLERKNILLTDYSDPGLAKLHLNAVKNDAYASIIKLKREEHLSKLNEMLGGDKYRLFWNIVKDRGKLNALVRNHYKDKIRKFVEQHTNWPYSTGEPLHTTVQVIFGEIFINLKWRTKRLPVKFIDIENAA
ncbi:MAG: hypothetical protein ABIN36_17160 [Ferruginibacter sp.]